MLCSHSNPLKNDGKNQASLIEKPSGALEIEILKWTSAKTIYLKNAVLFDVH